MGRGVTPAAAGRGAIRVSFTVDVEPDCPPYLSTWRGIDSGLPALFELLAEEGVPATCFTTGEVARRRPSAVQAILDAGHELGGHGDQHVAFTQLDRAAAAADLAASSAVLRGFGPVRTFRAPYLKFPPAYLDLLVAEGYTLDSSEARYKSLGVQVRRVNGLLRVPASVTSSTLRWPACVRDGLLTRLSDPVVLFVHPWEFVDLRRERLRWDCRFRTGEEALASVRGTLRALSGRGARFVTMSELEEGA